MFGYTIAEFDIALSSAQICLTKVRFVGHLISQNGIDPEPNKIDKLITFKRPEDKKSLQRIMGLYNYLGKFIPNLAASTFNIRGILRKNVVWHWGPKQDGEFDHIKECVRNAPSLAHFDKSKMLILQCDASKQCNGSCSATGRSTSSIRIRHLTLKLQYKPGKYLIVADTLSRDTHLMDELPTPFLEDKRMVKMVCVNISDETLVTLQKDTREDPALVKVIDYVIEGWPICKKDVDEDAKAFFDFRHRLYLWNDLLCIGSAIKKPHLLVVDRYSGYPEVFALDPPTAINVKNKLRETFARFGIPETMMSDNGPPFRSEFMTDFCIKWGSDPYLAILAYRNTPKNDLPSPAQLCLSRSLRCQIPRITPLYRPYQTNWRSIENAKRKRQSSMKEHYDRNSQCRRGFMVSNASKGETWTPVKISAQANSPQSFEVVTPSGNKLIRNQQFIRPKDGANEKRHLSSEPITGSPEAQHLHYDSPTMGESSTTPIQRSSEETHINQKENATTSAGISPEPSGRPRFSKFGRELRKPQRFCF
ncbi:K02A2.6-like [Cordylochernes scorpioides]|uniref:K02A2.6-like n=1 Tax=Cordylochernes scorpioides TaxID=51811 RepID=A0ABY6LMK4_9ARAC|nr:K02A2.6-like [Cordylochernes scorpioides]